MIEFKLAAKYFKKHYKQLIFSMLCIIIFASAILAVQLFCNSFNNAAYEAEKERIGFTGDIAKGADSTLVTKENLQKCSAGGIYLINEVEIKQASILNKTFLGYMDEAAFKIQNLKFLEGTAPKTENEIAIEEITYLRMNADYKIGDKVTLNVKENDKYVSKEYTLTGILKQYGDYVIAGLPGEPDLLPQIIVGKMTSKPYITNVVFDENVQLNNIFGGTLNYRNISVDKNSLIVIDILCYSLVALFVVLILIAINNIVKITVKEREKYIGLMRCIGLTNGQSFNIFIIQAILMALIAFVISGILGCAIYYFSILFMNSLNYIGYSFVLTLLPFIITFAIVFISIVGSYTIQSIKLNKLAPLEYNTVTNKRKKREIKANTFVALWNKVTSKINKQQKAMSVVLIAGCVIVMIIGPFLGYFTANAMYKYAIEKGKSSQSDFMMQIYGGGGYDYFLFTDLPRGSGITAEGINQLNEEPTLKVNYYQIKDFLNTRLVIDKDEKNESVLNYINSRQPITKIVDNKDFARKEMKAAGFSDDEELYLFTPTAIPTNALDEMECDKVAGNIDKTEFEKGNQIAVVGDKFKLGDTLTITYLTYPIDINTISLEDLVNSGNVVVPQVRTYKATVAAVYSPKNSSYATKIKDNVIMSSDLLLSIDPTLNYDRIYVDYVGDVTNQQQVEDAQKAIKRLRAQSYGVATVDFLTAKLSLNEMIKTYLMPTFIIIGIFMIFIFSALSLSNNIKIKSNLKSYALLRAIGMDEKQMWQIILNDSLKSTIVGTIAGIVVGIISTVIYAINTTGNINDLFIAYSNIWLYAVVGIICILVITVLSCISPKKWIMKQEIIDSINSVKY